MTRKNKNWNPEESVQNFFESAKSEFTRAEYEIIKEGYECLRQVVEPEMYSEVAMAIITVVYSRRKNNANEILTLDKVIKETVEENEPLFEEALSEVAPERLRELNYEDALSDKKDSLDQALASTIETLLDSNDIKIQIFLDMAVRGKTPEQVAKKHGIAVQNVYVLYETARDAIKEIMVLDQDVIVKDEPAKGTK